MVKVEEEHLADHTVSMRKALAFCQKKNHNCPQNLQSHPCNSRQQRDYESLDFGGNRSKALDEFWKNPVIDEIIRMNGADPSEFQAKYLQRNIPCLVRGLGDEYFSTVQQNWVKDGRINREWFIERLKDTLVPVRVQQEKDTVDEDGRAQESVVKQMTLSEYFQVMKNGDDSYYLKDWHFQKWWERREPDQELYKVPGIFEFDLLQDFLLKFTNGDYRFVYWGPQGSTTSLHTDVLFSYSWSFNVHGSKEWTFFHPSNSSLSCRLMQPAGTLVFVPATWPHRVVNMEETLSINHNWITASSIDFTWTCLETEIEAIRKELDEWPMETTAGAYESMLRGCLGLDVTAFVLMICSRLVQEDVSDHEVKRLRLSLRQILENVEQVDFLARLSASLECPKLGTQALTMMRRLLVATSN